MRLGQSLYAFIKGEQKLSGDSSVITSSSETTSGHSSLDQTADVYTPNRYSKDFHASVDTMISTESQYSNSQYSHPQSQRGGGRYGRNHRQTAPTGSHPHHQQIQRVRSFHSSSGKPYHRHQQTQLEFVVSLDNVLSGLDKRTSVMIRNIPNKYTQAMFLEELDSCVKGLYDFFYLPIDFKNKCNVGYAFLNVANFMNLIDIYKAFNDRVWRRFNSDKVCVVSYAKIQSKVNLINRFKNSSLMKKEADCRPLIFYSSGPRKGMPEPFPMPNRS